MEALQHLGVFAGQAFLIVIAIVVILVVFFSLLARSKDKRELEIESLNERFENMKHALQSWTLSKKELKAENKKQKKLEKEAKSEAKEKSKVYVLDFEGDMKASQTENLREEITAVLSLATAKDEVILRLESPGGMVHGYGLAASQLARIRERGIPLTICVDRVAASGGYMMACVGHKILAAPFAIIGSIGVIAQVPNFHRLLKKYDVDYEEMTAGEYKRTVSLLGEITEGGRKKFVTQLEETHVLFKKFITQFRPFIEIEKIATGEYWYGNQAIDLGLIDHISTSDDYLMKRSEVADIYTIKYHAKKSFAEKLSEALGEATHKGIMKVWQSLELYKWG